MLSTKNIREKVSNFFDRPYACTLLFPAVATTCLVVKSVVSGDVSYESIPIVDLATSGLGALTDLGRYVGSYKYRPKY
jgi:hypothetical protein